MNKSITIEDYNRMVGKETLHPLVTLAGELGKENSRVFSPNISLTCDFYALLYATSGMSLRLYCPGDTIEVGKYKGVLFHPDIFVGTHMEKDISRYPIRCRCKLLNARERQTISDCLEEIDQELHHSIDRFTAPIIVSHIGLLLDYCVRFCDTTCKNDSSIDNMDNVIFP